MRTNPRVGYRLKVTPFGCILKGFGAEAPSVDRPVWQKNSFSKALCHKFFDDGVFQGAVTDLVGVNDGRTEGGETVCHG